MRMIEAIVLGLVGWVAWSVIFTALWAAAWRDK